MYEMMVSYSIYIIVVGLVCSHDWKWCPRGPPLASAARDRNAHSTHLLICPSWTWKWPLCCAPLQRPGYLWLSLWVYVVSTMWYKFCPFLRGNIVFFIDLVPVVLVVGRRGSRHSCVFYRTRAIIEIQYICLLSFYSYISIHWLIL